MTVCPSQNRVLFDLEPEAKTDVAIITTDKAPETPGEIIAAMAEPQKCMIAEEMLWLIEEPQVLPSLPAGVVYFEISRFGGVQIHEMTRARLLLNAAADRGAAFLPTAETVEEAYCCLRAKVHQLETFDTLALAEHWAAGYSGFRTEEVRAELRRYQLRCASYRTL